MTQIALFPEDRTGVRGGAARSGAGALEDFELHRPRQRRAAGWRWGYGQQLQLDAFWQKRLPPSQKGTSG